jgi:hypothetical protein
MCLAVTLLLSAVLAAQPAAAAPGTGAAQAKPGGLEREDKGVRFTIPAGYTVGSKLEQEPNEPDDVLVIARRGSVEIRVEVEPGKLVCTGKSLAGDPRLGGTAGRPSCEVDLPAPPSLDAKIPPRRSTTLMVQFADRYLSVVVFAPDQATATRVARQVAATAVGK